MSYSRSRGAVLVELAALPLPATVACADDLLADGASPAPVGPNLLDVGTVWARATRTKPVAIAGKASNDPAAPDILVGGPTLSVTIPVPLRFRLAGDEPSGIDTAGWQIVRLQVDCADPDSMIASSLASGRAGDAGRPDRPQQADRPARGSRGSQSRGTKGGRSER
jgi:hypothetical protein